MTELSRYSGHEPGLEIIILRDKASNVFFKKCIYKEEVEILSVGESTYYKRLNKLEIHFPFVIFDILEAKKYGLQINCTNENKFWSYFGLTCDPETLELIKNISFEEAIGNHLKEDNFICPNCLTRWNIIEEYDSHHGYNRKCNKLSNE